MRTNAESTEHDDIICVGLTFLTMVLYDVKKKKDVNWEIFVSLVPTVEKFKQHCTPEVKFLATEVIFNSCISFSFYLTHYTLPHVTLG